MTSEVVHAVPTLDLPLCETDVKLLASESDLRQAASNIPMVLESNVKLPASSQMKERA
jgi:hypothetical protein